MLEAKFRSDSLAISVFLERNNYSHYLKVERSKISAIPEDMSTYQNRLQADPELIRNQLFIYP